MENRIEQYRRILALCLCAFIGSSTGWTADESKTNEVKKLEPTYVTGSNIPTLEAEPIAPVLKLDREAIEQSGAQNVSDLIRRLPQNSAGSFAENNASSFTPGSSGVSLRGLGQQSTLVLINGRRVVPYSFGQNINGVTAGFVDLNSIPLGAIEKVEVLKDSGSAIYGSDAIAGVINIILRKDFDGLELTGQYGNTLENDSTEQNYTFVGGIRGERSNMMLFLDYYDRHSQMLRDRPNSNSANQSPSGLDFRSGSSDVGRVLDPMTGDILYVPPSSNGILTTNDFLTVRPDENRYDYNKLIGDYPDTTRYGVYSVFNFKINDNIEAFVEANYRKVLTQLQSAATPVDGESDGYMVPASNPFNPFGTNVVFRWRAVQAGPRIDEVNTDAIRALPGLRFKIGDDWRGETAFLYSYSHTLVNGKNFLGVDKLNAALADTNPATALNVFGGVGYQNPQATIDGMKVLTTREGTDELMIYDIKLSGKLVDLPAGAMNLALGGEVRTESLSDVPDAISADFKVVSSGGIQPSSGSRDSDALYAELTIPVVGEGNSCPVMTALDVQLAGRFEYYSDFGTTWKPKVGLKWAPVKPLLIKASYSQGFRAPTLQELFVQNRGFQDGLVDTLRFDVTGADEDGGGTQYQIDSGGNAALDPENSESWYVGGILEVPGIKGLTVNLDYTRITVNDVIQAEDIQGILNLPLAQQSLFVQRAAPSATDIMLGIPGKIISIDQRFINLSRRVVDTIDLGVNYVRPTDIGEFEVTLNGSYFLNWHEKLGPGFSAVQYAGEYNIPKIAGYGSVFWNYKKFSIGPTVNYTSDYNDSFLGRRIREYITVDLQASYRLPWDTSVTVGVLNIADEHPPLSTQNTEGYDTATHDNQGRFWYVRATKTF